MLDSQEALDAETVRAHTKEVVHAACDADNPVLIEAPPSSGKTTSAYELVEVADAPITYLAEREDLYEDAKKWSQGQPDVNGKTIPSPQRDCPTFKGCNDGEQAKAEQLYTKGLSGGRIHTHDDVYTPCHSGSASCNYMIQRDEVQTAIASGDIDFLIGNHKHAQNEKYIRDRIVIFDEFNPGPFRDRFPSDERIRDSDHPGEVVSYFLQQLDKQDNSFPTETFADVTDILLNRHREKPLVKALNWFQEHGVSRGDVRDLDFYEVSSYRYDQSHLSAPLLVLGLLCMRKVGAGIEVAPPPEEYDLPEVRETWNNCGIESDVRCLRNRNTGEIFVLHPPDLTPAKQVIGLDGLPSKRLWDLIFAPDSSFDHRQIISREDFSRYLSSALGMTVKQIGEGRYPYAGGRISSNDKYRFAGIKSIENRRFPLISTKKALEEYDSNHLIEQFVKDAPIEMNGDDSEFAVMNYASVVSSNVFASEDLGVVSGSPFPGYPALRVWAGFCREEVPLPTQDEKFSFDGVADEVYKYLVQHQIIQAILRFGRDSNVWSAGGSTVYVNTTAIPEWFDTDSEIKIEVDTNRTDIIEYLIEAKHTDDRKPLVEQDVRSITEALGYDRDYINTILNMLEREQLLIESGRGMYESILYQWDGDERLQRIDGLSDTTHLLRIENKWFFLQLSDFP